MLTSSPLCGGKWELRNRPSSRAYVETFGGLVSGCRDPMSYIVRVCFLEDAVASLVLSFLSGVSLRHYPLQLGCACYFCGRGTPPALRCVCAASALGD